MIKAIAICLLLVSLNWFADVLVLSARHEARAETILGSPTRTVSISANTTWSASGSPYYVMGWMIINRGAKLTILPGTVVKFGPGVMAYIHGQLNILGTAEQPVVLTSVNDDQAGGAWPSSNHQPAVGDWAGLQVKDDGLQFTAGWVRQWHGGKLNMDYGVIKYSGAAKYFDTIMFDPQAAYQVASARRYMPSPVIYAWNGQVDINHSVLTDNAKGIDIWSCNNIINIRHSTTTVNGPLELANNSIDCYAWDWDPAVSKYHFVYYGPNTTTVTAIDNWWGDSSGPRHADNSCGQGGLVTGQVAFDPWVGKGQAAKRRPVIIVPGIISSYLNKNEPGLPEAWPNLLKMAMIGEDSYLYNLAMNDSGWPQYNNLKPTDIFRTIGDKDIFSGLIEELEQAGYVEGQDLFVYPYDWRLDVDWLAGDSPMPNMDTLKVKVDEVLATTGAEQVDVVAHSMGGMITKAYLDKYGATKINKFVDIATPHLGAPYAAKVLLYGDSMGFSLYALDANPQTMKKIAQNMPTVFALLPSSVYQQGVDSTYLADIYDADQNGIKGNLDYGSTRDYFKNVGLNKLLLANAEALHNRLDSMSIATGSNIVGCGVPTIGKLYLLNREKSGGHEYALRYVDGDGTVPLQSAEALDGPARYYVRGYEHGILSSADGVRQLVGALLDQPSCGLSAKALPTQDYSKAVCGISGQAISFHSPIDIHVYDDEGHHAGPDANGELENKISGVAYDIIEGNKFLFLPAGRHFRLEGQATAAGSFNARFQAVVAGEYTTEAFFHAIPLTTSTKISIPDSTQALIELDADGDGLVKEQVKPSAMLTGQELKDFGKPVTTPAIEGPMGWQGWYVGPVTVTLTATDNEGGVGLLKTEYKLDDGPWQTYINPIVIGVGRHTLNYLSTDKAGNSEDPQPLNINVDPDEPEISVLVPEEGAQLLHSNIIQPSFLMNDVLSGLATASTELRLDGQSIGQGPLDLFYLHIGQHELTISVADQAGNVMQTVSHFNVITDFASTRADISRLYDEQFISKKPVADNLTKLIDDLERLELKNQGLGNGQPNDIQLKQHINQLLTDIDHYLTKSWVNGFGYDIIKDEINYLTSKIYEN